MKTRKALKTATKVDFATYLGVTAAFVIVSLLKSGGFLNRSLTGMLVPICCYIVMAVSLNLTVGILGELSLGHAGFMSVGAFSGVIAAMSLQGAVPFGWVRLVIAIVVGAAMAAARMRWRSSSETGSSVYLRMLRRVWMASNTSIVVLPLAFWINPQIRLPQSRCCVRRRCRANIALSICLIQLRPMLSSCWLKKSAFADGVFNGGWPRFFSPSRCSGPFPDRSDLRG